MKLRDESESGARFEKYVDALASVIGHADRIGPLHDYCTEADPAGRSQERGAAGCEDGSEPDGGTASVLAAFCRQRRVVGRAGVGQGAREGAAGDRAAWADRGMDHRRYGVPQAGAALGRGTPSILRTAWQAGELSGRGDVVDRQSPRQPAGGVSAVSAEGLGGG